MCWWQLHESSTHIKGRFTSDGMEAVGLICAQIVQS